MPELPDVELYLHALRPRIVGHRPERIRIGSPFLLRTVDPPLHQIEGGSAGGSGTPYYPPVSAWPHSREELEQYKNERRIPN